MNKGDVITPLGPEVIKPKFNPGDELTC